MRLQEKMYYAVRSDRVESNLAEGVPLLRLSDNGEYGVMLFYLPEDAMGRCCDCYGEMDEEAHIFEVDMAGFTESLLNDFMHIRADENYIVFGEHTFLTIPVSSTRLKLL